MAASNMKFPDAFLICPDSAGAHKQGTAAAQGRRESRAEAVRKRAGRAEIMLSSTPESPA
jgi:hypothetical protein